VNVDGYTDTFSQQVLCIVHIHSKNYWFVLIQLWVKYGQTQPLGYIFLITFLTQRLGLSIFYPKLG